VDLGEPDEQVKSYVRGRSAMVQYVSPETLPAKVNSNCGLIARQRSISLRWVG